MLSLRPSAARYPPAGMTFPDSGAARSVGDSWLQSGPSLALEVRSVHSTSETNVLINPAHPDFARLVIGGNPVPFAFDRRLICSRWEKRAARH
jgi:RES domain-containing protein